MSHESDLKRARIYDDVADTYEHVNVPAMFLVPGRILAALIDPPRDARVLDAGAGTGAVARALRDLVGTASLVVAADASPSMLRAAAHVGLKDAVVTMLPVLPFASGAFDAVGSAFVMTHLDDADGAVAEMRRVLRPGGRIGLSAWYPAEDDAAREWSRLLRTFVDGARVDAAVRVTLPGDTRFARPDSLCELLHRAGFDAIARADHRIDCAMSVEDYVASRSVCATGRAVRALLAPGDWDKLRSAVIASLHERFPDGVRFSRGFHTAVGVRPA
jgi:SAM-dependent methyltransferase